MISSLAVVVVDIAAVDNKVVAAEADNRAAVNIVAALATADSQYFAVDLAAVMDNTWVAAAVVANQIQTGRQLAVVVVAVDNIET